MSNLKNGMNALKDVSISKYVLIFLTLTLVGYLYDKYQQKNTKIQKIEEHDLIRKYLLNGDALTQSKPILWIYIDYEPNSRHWEDFGSRLSNNLNQPYKYITIQSIIKQSMGMYNVCLIDDYSYTKLLPQWSVDVSKLADPVKTHIRSLALCNLLYHYGGMLVPSSYLAMAPIDNLYKMIVDSEDKCVIMESRSTPGLPDHLFMGCGRENNVMKELIQYIEYLVSRDLTAEQDFSQSINKFCSEHVAKGKMILVDGKLIGIKTRENKVIEIDDLLETSDTIPFSDKLQGILIPDKDILKRTKYEWFARMSPAQIFEERSVLCKYLLLSTVNP
jgi:hypothetical protein